MTYLPIEVNFEKSFYEKSVENSTHACIAKYNGKGNQTSKPNLSVSHLLAYSFVWKGKASMCFCMWVGCYTNKTTKYKVTLTPH